MKRALIAAIAAFGFAGYAAAQEAPYYVGDYGANSNINENSALPRSQAEIDRIAESMGVDTFSTSSFVITDEDKTPTTSDADKRSGM